MVSFGLSIPSVPEGIKSVGALGQDYLSRAWSFPSFDFLNPVGYLLSCIQFPVDLFKGFHDEISEIMSKNVFKYFVLTIKNLLICFWDTLFGQGFCLYGNEKATFAVKVALFILRTMVFIAAAFCLFIFPTTVFGVLVVSTIFFNFGGSLSLVSAGCVIAYITLNLATRLWIHHQGDAIDQNESETIGKILDTSGESVRELSELVKSSSLTTAASGKTELPSKRSLFGRALQWHLSLFDFYDHLLQPIFDQQKDM